MAANKGWICLHRSIQESSIWNNDEPFDRRSAWIDLILSANHEDREIMFDSHVRIVKRGQLITSVRKLSEKWSWSEKRTLKFLRLLEEAKMISKNSDNRATLLTVLNYAKYQDLSAIEGKQQGQQGKHSGNTPDYTPIRTPVAQTTINNNYNNDNNDNNMASPPTHSFTPYVYKESGKPKQTQFHKDMQTNKYDFAALEQYLLERDRPKGDEL